MRIPPEVFSAVQAAEQTMFTQPTCACFMAVDVGLPTKVARHHLEYVRHRGMLTRIELKRFCRSRDEWFRSVLADPQLRTRFLEFPSDLPVFCPEPNDEQALRASLRSMVRGLSFMFSIYDQAVFNDAQRLGWLFRAALLLLGRAGLKSVEANPIGLSLMPFAARPQSVRRYLSQLREASPGFASFNAPLTTQLRVLAKLALRMRGCSEAQLDKLSDAERSDVVLGFEAEFIQGLEAAPGARPKALADLIGAELIGAAWRDEDGRECTNDGVADWVNWAWPQREDRPLSKDYWVGVIARMARSHDDLAKQMMTDLKLPDDQRREIQSLRACERISQVNG